MRDGSVLHYLSDAEVIAAFGDPAPYVRADGTIANTWEEEILGEFGLPASLPLSFDHKRHAVQVRCHKRIVPLMLAAFSEIHEDGDAWRTLDDIGGAYCWRQMKNSKVLSRHCWAVAVDLDAVDNPMGKKGRMDPRVVAAFERNGFLWGDRFHGKRRDPMHFEFGDPDRLTA